ncbi:hypothetical protein BS50DRAFT_678700 [Corynespora cassiicola Philippines]|uniref:Uncharacterized protein n=1 Tax=Corynespora cassiicola Philippines TaxID=1448308 RepID=A0A2T2NHA7_CORCC|nr:hypothetical protein BS50DRAFT_678700 [Corynespora cassiicola Philippines]
MSFISTTATSADFAQVVRSADSLTVVNDYSVASLQKPYAEAYEDEADDAYLTANCGVTGNEPDTNPPSWPSDHRRVPPHRPPFRHPEWVVIGGPLPMRIFLWDMFCGCQLLQWSYSLARTTGLHDRGLCMYKVANEW